MKEITLEQAYEIIGNTRNVVLDSRFRLTVFVAEDMDDNPLSFLACYNEQSDDSNTLIEPEDFVKCKWFIDNNIIIAKIDDKEVWYGDVYTMVNCEELIENCHE